MSKINVPKVPQMQPLCQSYKASEEPSLKKISSKSEELPIKKSSFVSKLKSKMKRSNTPNNGLGIEEFNPSKSYKNVYSNAKNTMKRSSSSSNKSQKKLSEKPNNNVFDGEYLIKRNNNFVISNQEGTSSSIELKNIQNLGIQINNNINVIINSNSNQNSNENLNLIKPFTNELSNNSLNGIINTKIVINGKKVKNNAGFMTKSKQKFNKINEVMAAMANERKGGIKDEKLIIFPTDYLKSLPQKDKLSKNVEISRGRENNFSSKEGISKSQNNIEIK